MFQVLYSPKRDSIAAKAGLNVGMVICQISKNVDQPKDAKNLKKKADSILDKFMRAIFQDLVLKLK